MSQDLFSVAIVSLPLNFTILLNPDSMKSLEIEENGFALIKGVNGTITVVKVIKDSDCPVNTTRITHSVQLTLAASPGDKIPILPFSGDDQCNAIQIAPLFEKTNEDYQSAVKHYFASDSRPISTDSIFTLKIGSHERAFKILSCLPVDRSFSNNSTKLYFTNEPGPLLPKPILPKHLSTLVLDNEIIDFVKNNVYYPANHQKLLKALNFPGSSGIIISGPSGSGKTSLLSAISYTINIPSIYCSTKRLKKLSTSDFVDKLNQIFGFTAEKPQCLIMLDDLDYAITSFKDAKLTSEKCKLATFFSLFDIVMQRPGIFVIATVSSIEKIDPSLLREGRFGHQIHLHNPSIDQRKSMIKMFTCGMRVDNDDLEEIANQIDDSLSVKEIEKICRFAVASLIEEVTGTQGSDISEALAVYALNTKMKSMHFGFGGRRRRRRNRDFNDDEDENDEDDEENDRHHGSRHRRRHRRRHHYNDSSDDQNDDNVNNDDDDDDDPFSRRPSKNSHNRRRRRIDSEDENDDYDENDRSSNRRRRRHRYRDESDEDEDNEDDVFRRRSRRRGRNDSDDEDDENRPSNNRRRKARNDPFSGNNRNDSDEDDSSNNRRKSKNNPFNGKTRRRNDEDDDDENERKDDKRRKGSRNQRYNDDDNDVFSRKHHRRRRGDSEDDEDDDFGKKRRTRRKQNDSDDDSDEDEPRAQRKRKSRRNDY
ncbi:hypothetical protein TRFO_03809 [Tritrichomonas foetus]|uniref:AAA+ ATPase domain-containing protein n=1 Tax=Tritrichomonas foetus TaxID=1144522 RepID=A0A1J4KP95_9EUKA|nr:hypothetical protein TRFO_03809 [Tritrichomonas foetus]|eukprot:OHT11620.1 hypothetical protein TRFO_03809 [Tritrichomonas foetus]